MISNVGGVELEEFKDAYDGDQANDAGVLYT